MRDATERKQAEKERRKLAAQLQQAQKMESIGTLAGGIAHDFNNMLGVIAGNTEMAMDEVSEGSRALHNLKEVQKAALRARDMVSQILAFSRQTRQEQRPLRLGGIVQESLKLLRASIPTTIEIRERLSRRHDTVLADPTQLHQVLINLCANAAHAMRESGGVLEVGVGSLEIAEDAPSPHHDLEPGQYVLLAVEDTGRGSGRR